MSAFPAKILVATDGSEDAALAVRAAVDLSKETGAGLHVVHVGESLPVYPPPAAGPPPSSPSSTEIQRMGRGLLDAQIELVGELGSKVEEATCGRDALPKRFCASAKT